MRTKGGKIERFGFSWKLVKLDCCPKSEIGQVQRGPPLSWAAILMTAAIVANALRTIVRRMMTLCSVLRLDLCATSDPTQKQ